MHIEDASLERVVGRLAQRELDGLGLKVALGEVVAAMPPLFRVDGAGLLLLDEDQVLRYVASTDSGARLLESVQESAGRGPCVQSLVEGVVVQVDDLLADERWPDLAEVLVPNGVRAVLGSPIRIAGAPVGSLNVYRRESHCWDDSDRAALASFERLVERLLVAAVLGERRESTVSQLQHALDARVAIERAVGVVMATEGLGATDAFERIRRHARSNRRTVREIATEVTEHRRLL